MDRITIRNVRRAAAYYAGTLAGLGWERADRIDVRAPYGRVWYVVTYDETRPAHDVPGFEGSGGSGFVTARDGHAAIMSAMRTASDLRRVLGLPFDQAAATRARVAVLDRVGLGGEVHADERAAVAS